MSANAYNLLLADDDADDRMFFQEALDELTISTKLTTVNDGVQLMDYLKTHSLQLPELIFMDLNMPRKTGFDCLAEIKASESLRHIPIIVFSTSFDQRVVDNLYEDGANHYIRKPGEFSQFKEVISQALELGLKKNSVKPEKEKFVIRISTDSINDIHKS